MRSLAADANGERPARLSARLAHADDVAATFLALIAPQARRAAARSSTTVPLGPVTMSREQRRCGFTGTGCSARTGYRTWLASRRRRVPASRQRVRDFSVDPLRRLSDRRRDTRARGPRRRSDSGFLVASGNSPRLKLRGNVIWHRDCSSLAMFPLVRSYIGRKHTACVRLRRERLIADRHHRSVNLTMIEVPPEQWTGGQAACAAPVRDCSYRTGLSIPIAE
jgi:hypothetical protein